MNLKIFGIAMMQLGRTSSLIHGLGMIICSSFPDSSKLCYAD